MKRNKRIFYFALAVVLLVCSLCIPAFAEDSPRIGDADRDGDITTEDARIALEMFAGITEPEFEAVDMDADGEITLEDVRRILNAAVTGIVIAKTGDNYLSDDPNNKFIQIVMDKYGSNLVYRPTKDKLVAIFSVSEKGEDQGNNFVLQFKNSRDRGTDDLEVVYHIDANGNISATKGKMLTGNDNCQAAEGMIVFSLVKNSVMPQYPDYFDL